MQKLVEATMSAWKVPTWSFHGLLLSRHLYSICIPPLPEKNPRSTVWMQNWVLGNMDTEPIPQAEIRRRPVARILQGWYCSGLYVCNGGGKKFSANPTWGSNPFFCTFTSNIFIPTEKFLRRRRARKVLIVAFVKCCNQTCVLGVDFFKYTF